MQAYFSTLHADFELFEKKTKKEIVELNKKTQN